MNRDNPEWNEEKELKLLEVQGLKGIFVIYLFEYYLLCRNL